MDAEYILNIILEKNWAEMIKICPKNKKGRDWWTTDFSEITFRYQDYRAEIIDQLIKIVRDDLKTDGF